MLIQESLPTVQLAHELPERLRLSDAWLTDRRLDRLSLEAALLSLGGVRGVRFNPHAGSVAIEYDGQIHHRQAILTWLQRPPPELLAESTALASSPDPDLLRVFSALLGLAALPLLTPPLQRGLTYALIAPTVWEGVQTLSQKGLKIEVLDSLAVSLAAARGKYFTAVATQGLLALGAYLEQRTARHADDLLRHLLKPMPTQAWVERDGALAQIPCSALQVGDQIEVGPGDMIPIDGKVIGGNAAVNQASVTGENLAVRKEAGDKVLSGTVLEGGRLRIRATRVGAETTTARIARFIENALQQQSQTQTMAEKLADQRVYLTLSTGALVYAVTRDLDRLASVFLVDYACALKLGTPVAIKSAMYQGAKHGILFRSSSAIDSLAQADTFVFDKTGTLTSGLLDVTDVHSLDAGWEEAHLLALVASIEEHATHPVADAVVKQAREQHLGHIEHEDVDYLVAHGLTTHAEGGCVVIGSRHFLETHQNISFAAHEAQIAALEQAGKTLLYVALEQRPLGLIGLRDSLRPEAKTVLAQLRQSGVRRLVLLTGDRQDKAEALARELGMDAVYAECPPEGKAAVVEQLRAHGAKVAFIGDGVNDAPALIAADVGIAMPRGADLARATADIVLLDDHLQTLVAARILSVGTLRLIRNHFHISTGVNTAVITGAAFGWLSPVWAALLHNGMTLGVLLNSMAGVSLKTKRLEAFEDKLHKFTKHR
ncbi:MAG: heavy metal translocating P-type ATPase [Synechococcaceae cyanobacterium SM1_2_3]|nr:heavy metal translocating P-type ATPase [Synechococcaceae cyanobacterium SM1_2_3]